MSRIILTPEQLRTFAMATDAVEICDTEGKVLFRLKPTFTNEEIVRALTAAKSPGPLVPAEQVRQTLKILQETWDKEGPFDHERMEKILAEIRASRNLP
jgi:hypothetical protein